MKRNYEIEIENCDLELSNIKNWIHKNELDNKSRYLISYAVIRVSGLIEKIFKAMIYDWLSVGASKDNCSFLEYYIVDSSSNPTTGNIETIIQRFNPEFKRLFVEKVKECVNLKADLNQIVEFRNRIAHGDNINTSIESIIKMYNNGKNILFIIDEIFK